MLEPIRPEEGWGVLHLFLRVDHAAVPSLAPGAAKEFADVLERWSERTQLHVFSVLGHKADVMLMAIDADLSLLRALQTEVQATQAAPAVRLTWSYLSLTEGSEYMQTPEEYREYLASEGVEGEDLDRRVEQFAERMTKYTDDKLHPRMPAWELACFYPMSHRREGADNWYSLDFPERRRLMHDHGKSGRAYTGRILQLVSGSTGLDEWEWGVTLFAHDLADVKDIVYTMRYDEASARFAEFGDFVIGLRRSPADLVTEIGLERGA
ncbi:chlorite dismutase family protein [Egicoccus halophilus]|uniref:Coproheme decarboxylase n=1 Tax=Egicoccus halophilus TaxID=1670830 RepID=A0A8J3A8H4_9ACTN|nr:chlorite dismutase family protein [Egicoccus halophilus]GGI04639.1 heme peroxidase [Egicoccus halophilus]